MDHQRESLSSGNSGVFVVGVFFVWSQKSSFKVNIRTLGGKILCCSCFHASGLLLVLFLDSFSEDHNSVYHQSIFCYSDLKMREIPALFQAKVLSHLSVLFVGTTLMFEEVFNNASYLPLPSPLQNLKSWWANKYNNKIACLWTLFPINK